MSDQLYSSDNAGNRVPATPGAADPVAASGIVTTMTNAGTNYPVIVVAGESYSVVAGKAASAASGEIVSLSITGTAVTNANKEWNIGLAQTIIIKIPVGVTQLHSVSTLAATILYMAKLKI